MPKNAEVFNCECGKRVRDLMCCYIKQPTATIYPIENPNELTCNLCDYSTSSKKDFKKHILTRKHQLATNTTKKIPKVPEYSCECVANINPMV